MKIKIQAFGIAKDILQSSEMEFELGNGQSVEQLKSALINKFPEFEKLRKFSIAVNQEYRGEDYIIRQGDEVVIIPPVSGG